MSGSITLKNIKSVAIGNFDGIHRGHQQLLAALDANSAVIVIENNNGCLTPGEARAKFIKQPVFFYHLEKIKHLGAKEFIALLQKDFPVLEKVIIGYDFVFGNQRHGDARLLKNYFDVVVIEQFCIAGIAIHSRLIRQSLQQDYERAKRYLGREYEIEGVHIKGQGIASKSLVPTINLHSHYCLPKEGVYATISCVDGQSYASISFVGHRKTTDNKLAIETHILDCKITLKSQRVGIVFCHYLRPNKKFESLGMLKEAIEKDIITAKRYHGKR